MDIYLERLIDVYNQIYDTPDRWDQQQWHCNTSHCFAGWAHVHSGEYTGDAPDDWDIGTQVSDAAKKWLNLEKSEADYLFAPERTLLDIYLFVLGKMSIEPQRIEK